MGWAYAIGFCVACKQPIQFNPHAVPSLMVNGTREPLCRQCAERWNEMHPENARPIQPNAYEAIPEEDL